MNKTKNSPALPQPKISSDILITQKHLDATEARLTSKMTTLELQIGSVKEDVLSGKHETASIRAEIASVREEIQSVLHELRALEKKIDSRFESMMEVLLKMQVNMEEQNARNKVALDGYALVYEGQKNIEARLDTAGL